MRHANRQLDLSKFKALEKEMNTTFDQLVKQVDSADQRDREIEKEWQQGESDSEKEITRLDHEEVPSHQLDDQFSATDSRLNRDFHSRESAYGHIMGEFESLDKSFDEIGERLDAMDGYFNEMAHRFRDR